MPTPHFSLVLLPFALAISIWVSWSDLKRMKIPNKAVIAMAAVWPLVGWYAVPTWEMWYWGFALLAIVFAIGYAAFVFLGMGAGDAKFMAAMAPCFVGGDVVHVMLLVSGCMIGALAVHRILRRIPIIRRMTPDWISWDHRRFFPLGFALSAILIFYLLAAFWPQL
jgi:prepilin peptidase CpaA